MRLPAVDDDESWDVRRRECVHVKRSLRERGVPGDADNVHAERLVPFGDVRGRCMPKRSLAQQHALCVDGQPLSSNLQLPGRGVYGLEPGGVHGWRPVQYGGDVQRGDGFVPGPHPVEWHAVYAQLAVVQSMRIVRDVRVGVVPAAVLGIRCRMQRRHAG